jgi:CBS domain-containing protein
MTKGTRASLHRATTVPPASSTAPPGAPRAAEKEPAMSDVSSVMTPNPTCCRDTTPLREVAQMMIDNDCGQIPVVDAGHKPVGVVTDRDITVRIVAAGKDPASATAADAMSSPCKSIGSDTSLHDCTCLMEAEKIRRVPVVDADGKLAGIVSIADIALAGKREATADVVLQVSEPGNR